MIAAGWLWVVFTVLAAAGQAARNAMQRELTAALGTVGATHVRFLFGFPFALVFLAIVISATGHAMPSPGPTFLPWVLLGAGSQIFSTALMLAAMNDRSFVVTIAYTKTEVIQAAIFGLLFLGDPLTVPIVVAILVATSGVWMMSFKGGAPMQGGLRPTLLGLASGAMLALSVTGYRGAILSLGLPNFVVAATFTLAVGLVLQSALLTIYLLATDRGVLVAIARAWRKSLFAGFMGATASQFWFLAFALTSAANVRTIGLVEVLFAQAISFFVFRQATSAREAYGMAMIVAGVALLIWAQ
ncbi:MAG: DMT family transporter [Alphaproteobacteria bacterium]|nr:DMT family transporter [Alphaproteobacteria bacterium]